MADVIGNHAEWRDVPNFCEAARLLHRHPWPHADHRTWAGTAVRSARVHQRKWARPDRRAGDPAGRSPPSVPLSASRAAKGVSAETACESLHKALPRKRRPGASKRPEARRSRTCRT